MTATNPAMMRFADMSVGTQLGPHHYTLSAEAHDQYLEACQADAGLRDLLRSAGDVAHPTFTVTDYHRMLTDRYGNMGTGLHTRHESAFLRPIPIGADVEVRGELVDLYERNGRDYWKLVYSATDSAGVAYVTHTMTSTIDRPDQDQPQRPSGDAPPASPAPEPTAAEPHGAPAGRHHTFSVDSSREFARHYVVRYGLPFETSTDAHVDQAFARSIGLPDVIAHSSQYYAWLAEAGLDRWGADYLSGGHLGASFRSPVFAGDGVTVAVGDADDSGQVPIELVSNAGVVVSKAQISRAAEE